jgi:hypothetical protein
MPKTNRRLSESDKNEKSEKTKDISAFRIPKRVRRSIATQTHYGYCHTGSNLVLLVDVLLSSLITFKTRFVAEREQHPGQQ